MKLDKGLMAGSGAMLVLKLLESGDMYGYQMIESCPRRSNQVFQMQEGTLYPSSTAWRRTSTCPPTSNRPPRGGCANTTS